MSKKMFYTEEKALYFAVETNALHVAPDEKSRNTDLWQIVKKAEREGFLVRAAEDDSGWYYTATKYGQMRLLELQIEWRESHRRDASSHRAKLDELREA